jgi:DNA end-binding protein Ku
MWGDIMALRSSWKGYLKLSLVSVPVRAFSAISPEEGEIHFNQLHEKCHSRIRYVKTCPKHGPVSQDEIVLGYEYAKGQYVVVEGEELDRLQADVDKSVNVDVIVPVGSIDPLYLTERTSYLLPDGVIGQKPYAVIQKCLQEQKVVAIGRIIRNGKDEVVMVRPLEHLLAMTVLSRAAEVKSPQAFVDELPQVSVSAAELKLTKTLFDAFHQDQVNLSEYKDLYTERLTELIEAKVAGKELVMPAPTEEPDVINLMDALKRSVAQARSIPAKRSAPSSPHKKLAKGTRPTPSTRRRAKSG